MTSIYYYAPTSGELHSSETSMIFKKRSKKDPAIFFFQNPSRCQTPDHGENNLLLNSALPSFLHWQWNVCWLGWKKNFPKISLFISHGLGGIKVLTPSAVNCKHVLIVDTITLQVTESVWLFLPFSCLWWGPTSSPVFISYSYLKSKFPKADP